MKLKLTSLVLVLFVATVIISSCRGKDDEASPLPPIEMPPEDTGPPEGTTPIDFSAQRTTGDPDAGYEYLIYGDYVDAGVPYDLHLTIFGSDSENLLGRTGDNSVVPPGFNAVDAPNGVRVIAANCFQCHAQELNGELILGLGNSVADFTDDQSANISFLDGAVSFTYGANSDEYEAYEPFSRAVSAIGPHVVAPKVGLNTAAKLSLVLAAHRNIDDLSWVDIPQVPIPEATIASDIPPWWLLKKKNAMFYSAGGKGDFARIMMASSLLTLQDSAKARIIDQNFVDVLAYINSIEPPAYPEVIDDEKALRGHAIYRDRCESCHGYHSSYPVYENLLVSLDVIGTDPLLASSNYADVPFQDWYNNSWFSAFPAPAEFTPEAGYIAPPLDGIWASAPYLHNASVPTLEDLLNSAQRPVYWERSFNTSDYDYSKVGWNYEVRQSADSKYIYDTTVPGYGNEGHNFGDSLTEEERSDLIEYLKTL